MVQKEIGQLEGVFWAGMGAFICILGWTSGLGSFREPAGGFVTFISGLFLCAVGAIMMIGRLISQASATEQGRGRVTLYRIFERRFLYTAGLLLAYTLLFDILGYIVVTFLMMWAMLYDRTRKNWITSCLASIVIVLLSYLVFETWLQCQLPQGIFPWR